MAAQKKYPDELRERAVRMVLEIPERDWKGHGEIARVARQLDVHPEALRSWLQQAEIDSGQRPGTTTDDKQYTAIRYSERLEEAKAVRSVGSKGDSYDNAAAESLNSLYKRELIDRGKEWQDVHDVMIATMDWVHWYNEERLHSYCGDIPPKEFEEIYYKAAVIR